MSEYRKKTPEEDHIDIQARESRFFRAAGTVLKNYDIIRKKELEEELVVFELIGGSMPYTVKIHPQWKCNPVCSCPDAEKRAKSSARGYCKHVIAVLLKYEEFSFQLLEAFL